ncbi:MAG TPA: glycosyltransferase family 1 protein [Chloroflexia bacterium]|nr:glycosyltransferase family 1 protein [Chloroflexia bacterium]
MRIALNGYFWDEPRTGSGQYLHHLWSALNRQFTGPGDSFTLLLPPSHGQRSRGLRGASTDKVGAVHSTQDELQGQGRSRHGFAVTGVGLPPGPAKARIRDRGSLLAAKTAKIRWEQTGVRRAAVKRRANVFHSPYLSAPFLQPCPTVVTAHDMIPWVVPGYAGSIQVRLYLAFSLAAVKRARLIIADSNASRADVIRVSGVSPHRVRTVYLGVEQHPVYTPGDLETVRARYGLPSQYAFYMGGFDSRKNVPLLLRAWRGFISGLDAEWCSPGAEPLLAIGGEVPSAGGVFPDVKSEATTLGWDRPGAPLRFLGRIPEEDKPLLMAAARLFVYPSAYEGFGLDPLEAMSVGCPVVSSSGGSLSEVVGCGGILVAPGDEEGFTRAVSKAWSDPELRRELSAKGKEQSRQFTWTKTAEQTHSLYQLAVRHNHAKAG